MEKYLNKRYDLESDAYYFSIDGEDVAIMSFLGGYVERPSKWHVYIKSEPCIHQETNLYETGLEMIKEHFNVLLKKD